MTNIGTDHTTSVQSTGGPDDNERGKLRGFDDADVDSGRRETVAGAILVGLTLVAALYFRWRPGPIFLDRWGFSLVHPALSNQLWKDISQLRSTSLLVGGSILSAVIVYQRDRWRALSCLVAPSAAVALTELVLKPEIARRYAEVLTFPSGTTTIVSGVVMAFIIAVPRRYRPEVIVFGAFVVVLECMAVIALQWHFPTDALGGAIFGAGMVLMVDGVLHIEVGIRRRHARARADRAVPLS
jgi:membrane-associated phospholipid phosphatase